MNIRLWSINFLDYYYPEAEAHRNHKPQAGDVSSQLFKLKLCIYAFFFVVYICLLFTYNISYTLLYYLSSLMCTILFTIYHWLDRSSFDEISRFSIFIDEKLFASSAWTYFFFRLVGVMCINICTIILKMWVNFSAWNANDNTIVIFENEIHIFSYIQKWR